MSRAQIIADLMACLAAIAPAAGFPARVAHLKRGIHLVSQFNELPALALYNQRVTTVEVTGPTAERVLLLHLWGAAPAPGGNFAQLDALAAACVRALHDPALNPHARRTGTPRLELYEGGAGDPLGLFDLEVQVGYESALEIL